MRHLRRAAAATATALMAALTPAASPLGSAAGAQDVPRHLRDRGTGVATSQCGTYVRGGELLVYPFFEWYRDRNLEYKPTEFGYDVDVDYRGRYRAAEGRLFLGYGVGPDLALELEGAPLALPTRGRAATRGLHLFRDGLPGPKDQAPRRHAGGGDNLGVGAIRGYRWGTMTVRAAAEYARDEGEWKLEAGEYAVEYLKRLSPSWRVAALVEGNQLDDVDLITEVQWRFHRRAFFKVNSGLELTRNATDFAPEVGLMLTR